MEKKEGNKRGRWRGMTEGEGSWEEGEGGRNERGRGKGQREGRK